MRRRAPTLPPVIAAAAQPSGAAADVLDRVLSSYRYPFALAVLLSLAARALAIVHLLCSNDGYAVRLRPDRPHHSAASAGTFRTGRYRAVGDRFGFSGPDVRVAATLVSVWPLGKPWARAGLFAQASGDRLLNATESEARSAEEYCPSVDSWPAKESAILMGNVAVVCLP